MEKRNFFVFRNITNDDNEIIIYEEIVFKLK